MELLVSRQLYKILLFSLSVFNVLLYHGLGAEKLWVRESAFDDKFPTSGLTFISRSRIHCGKACSQNDTCASFFFASGQGWNCQLHDRVLSSVDGLADVKEAAYYVLYGTEPASTAPSPTTEFPPFACPPDDTIFRTVQLSDGNNFTYKVVKALATKLEAAKVCSDQDSYLARVTTIAEMNMLLNLIINCTGYNDATDYYVDGSNPLVSDSDDGGPWLMSNGDPVPMSNDFWGYTFPNNPTTEHCLRMRAEVNYMWDDCFCSQTCYFICEK